MVKPSKWIAAVGGLAVMASLAACAPVVESRGNLPNPELLAQIKPGLQTKEDVGALLGTPSSTAVFGEETWYYISSREEHFAFYKPKELDRQVVAIRFDQGGAVSEIKTLTLKDGKVIDPVDRTTPTAGSEMGFLQQIFGNVGRFNKDKK